jgi:MFS transporter, PPP family, 3-phenylpropionic acid transporter
MHNWRQSLSTLTFLNFAARGLTVPFISLYLVSVGFSGFEVGLVLSLSAGLRLIVPPLLSSLADRNSTHRRLFVWLLFANTAATIGFILGNLGRLWLGLMVILRDLADLPGASLLAELSITRLKRERRDIYGRIRAWGSLGWAVTTMISGLIFAAGGYSLLFIAAAATNLLSLPFVRSIPAHTGKPESDEPPEFDAVQGRSPTFILLMVGWFLFTIGMTTYLGFAFVYYQQALGASTGMIGVLVSVAALAEIPSMMVMERVMRVIPIRYALIIGILGMAGIWFVSSLLIGTSLLLPLMLIRGTFYSFQHIAITLLVSRISHPANAATNQTIAQGTVPALAQLLTGPIAGWIFDNLGPRVLFQLMGLVAVLGVLLLFAARRRFMPKRVLASS